MPSRSTSSPNKSLPAGRQGFTLIELLIAIAILTATFSLGAYLSLDAYRATLGRSDRDSVVSLLEEARSRALANVYQTSWGVCYIAPDYILFRGTACAAGAATNESTPASPNITVTGMQQTSPVVFSELAATTSAQTITITGNGRTNTLQTTYEGAIIW